VRGKLIGPSSNGLTRTTRTRPPVFWPSTCWTRAAGRFTTLLLIRHRYSATSPSLDDGSVYIVTTKARAHYCRTWRATRLLCTRTRNSCTRCAAVYRGRVVDVQADAALARTDNHARCCGDVSIRVSRLDATLWTGERATVRAATLRTLRGDTARRITHRSAAAAAARSSTAYTCAHRTAFAHPCITCRALPSVACRTCQRATPYSH